jgi:hypothetical protein
VQSAEGAFLSVSPQSFDHKPILKIKVESISHFPSVFAWSKAECASAIVSFHVNHAQNEAALKYVQTVFGITILLSVQLTVSCVQVLSPLERAAG